MGTFKKYQRTQVGELRPVTEVELLRGIDESLISVSHVDKVNGSPRKGDMIARNPDNHEDQWLVSKEYFEKNFSLLDSSDFWVPLDAACLYHNIPGKDGA